MLAKTQCHTDFFVTERRIIRWEVSREWPFVMAGTASDRAF